MGNKYKGLFIFLPMAILSISINARENVGQFKTIQPNVNVIAAACSPATAKTVFQLNNVRTTLLTGGDMWWETGNSGPKYEIPKGGTAHSLFAGALWIGGIDAGGQLKVAAMTYRQNGNDFWPGTLDTVNVSTEDVRCNYYDKHFRIRRTEVDSFIGWNNDPNAFPGYSPPTSILNWPANPYFANETRALAPYHDGNNNGIYDPPQTPDASGEIDYPNYNVKNSSTCSPNFIFGDETLWWVFNDKGNIHSESGGQSIGLEIHAQAFAFSTNDEINNMTFYKYKILNRSSFSINQTYFGQWVDADLGGANDDYVGCDVTNGLGYCYNGDAYDESSNGSTGYFDELPAVGIDFFEGPYADPDGLDNPRSALDPASANGTGYANGVVDDERLGMAKFVYYNNDFLVTGNPEDATDFYNYCSGFWKDGVPFTYGGDAYNEGDVCSFMFPGDSDPLGYGTGGVPQSPWSEVTVGNTPADRRFFQSAGPFTLQPGAVNYITVGAVWARGAKGAPSSDVIALLKTADIKAQTLFENCFRVLDGPDAPDLTIQEFDKELILYLTNKATSNNYKEKYSEVDPIITFTNNTYDFEGYQIFQLKDGSVSSSELNKFDKARLVKQVDVENGVTQLVNYYYDVNLKANMPVEEVNGEDKGIAHSFKINEDQFAQGNKTLINHKKYYFMVVAYAYNDYLHYDQNDVNTYAGQKFPYKAGRRNIRSYTAIPHIPTPEAGGTVMNSSYGIGPKIQRIEGQGNGGAYLKLSQESTDKILSSPTHRDENPIYEGAVYNTNLDYTLAGPVKVIVIDPLNVPEANFTFQLMDTATIGARNKQTWDFSDAFWKLTNTTTGEVVYSDNTIQLANEQIIPQWGISISALQVSDPGTEGIENNGYLDANMSFSNPDNLWLTGLPDGDFFNSQNWIRSGTKVPPDVDNRSDYEKAFDDITNSAGDPVDPDEDFEKILGGTWAPFGLCAYTDPYLYSTAGPGWKKSTLFTNLNVLHSADIVITSDTSKWTRCPVLELQEETALAIGGAKKLRYRNSPSVDKEGNATYPGKDNNDFATGMGWFPGYAINVETGERLNMAFGEDSWLVSENGHDMIWNPTSSTYGSSSAPYFGGKHYIYVFNHISDNGTRSIMPRYDKGAFIRTIMDITDDGNPGGRDQIFKMCTWVNIPLLTSKFSHLSKPNKNIEIPSDVKVEIRVTKPYRRGYSTQEANGSFPGTLVDTAVSPANNQHPMYAFSTAGFTTSVGNEEAAKSALDLINIVPNPYYAYSAYEGTKVDNTVKITNLPEKCTVRIYTLSGILIRTINIDQPAGARDENGTAVTSLDWDLKNQANIPISGGLYLIHVEAPNLGERVLKWFGVMRPIDLESY